MADEKLKEMLADVMAELFQRSQMGGKFGPIEDRYEYEKGIKLLPPEEQELVRELTNYADLVKYFAGRKMKTGADIADAMFAAAKLPLAERTGRVRQINQVLMERLNDAGEGAQFRN
jgi:hypothetical protein